MKYGFERWVHTHYVSVVEAGSLDEARRIAKEGGGKCTRDFTGVEVKDMDITPDLSDAIDRINSIKEIIRERRANA